MVSVQSPPYTLALNIEAYSGVDDRIQEQPQHAKYPMTTFNITCTLKTIFVLTARNVNKALGRLEKAGGDVERSEA